MLGFSDDYVKFANVKAKAMDLGTCRFTVFYDVHPSEVWNQTQSFSEAFVGYEEQCKAEADGARREKLANKVKSWRAALMKPADLAGMSLRDEADG
ncbi:hypothetical protein RJ640_013709 [Escallonia rubra]|uniref:Uncharacterized protein n=1 Tax=Escallonia rubra TaxID=112253 RepID=A0AA88QJT6_9ASTE|nr:hypothetical protein RJ640_013709 [Escallonia rubra]